jgi:hypothetical protein
MARTPGFKITKTTNDMLAENRKPPVLPETGWWKVGPSEPYEIEFGGTWENVGASAADASWYLSEDGEVRLRGKIGGGADDTVAFVLPEEVRPEFVEVFVVPADDEGNIDLSAIKFRAYQEGDV